MLRWAVQRRAKATKGKRGRGGKDGNRRGPFPSFPLSPSFPWCLRLTHEPRQVVDRVLHFAEGGCRARRHACSALAEKTVHPAKPIAPEAPAHGMIPDSAATAPQSTAAWKSPKAAHDSAGESNCQGGVSSSSPRASVARKRVPMCIKWPLTDCPSQPASATKV